MKFIDDAYGLADPQDLTLEELAASSEAASIVARLTRKDSKNDESVWVAAFNSFI